MPQVINTNVSSLTAQRSLNMTQTTISTTLQRLSSGLRINSAKDDAAGLQIAERFTAQIRGLDQARRNANDGVSLSQTAEGSLGSAGDILQRIRELAVQSANATNSGTDRAALNQEVSQLTQELDRIASSTEFNGQKLLDGSFSSAVFQVGANVNQTITATSSNFRSGSFGTYRVGAQAATTSAGEGTLTAGSTVGAQISQANTAAGVSRITADTLDIAGPLGTSTGIAINIGMSAKDAATAVNAESNTTGVTATAYTDAQLNGFVANSAYSIQIVSDNASTQPETVTFSTGAAINADGLSSAVDAFNNASSKTGVVARLNSTNNGIILTNASGNDIRLLNQSAAASAYNITDRTGANSVASAGQIGAGVFGTNDFFVTGELTFDASSSFAVTQTAAGGIAGFMVTGGAVADVAQLQKVAQLDVGSVSAANRAISIVDGALAAVNGQRAKYGALQSRFEAAINNLQVTSENLSSSRSRIRDADFADETAKLARNQVLQQAGLAMLSQANSLPQNVLTLLR